MKCSIAFLLTAIGLLVAPLIVVGDAAAMPENVCQARCSKYNPVEFPKEQRWTALKQYDQCLATCRKSPR